MPEPLPTSQAQQCGASLERRAVGGCRLSQYETDGFEKHRTFKELKPSAFNTRDQPAPPVPRSPPRVGIAQQRRHRSFRGATASLSPGPRRARRPNPLSPARRRRANLASRYITVGGRTIAESCPAGRFLARRDTLPVFALPSPSYVPPFFLDTVESTRMNESVREWVVSAVRM